jgi:predicted GIY-YIG superfamily endonuclease
MANPYAIEIFVADGKSDGLKLVSSRNWTGVALDFPREQWQEVRKRSEFDKVGIYILTGYYEEDEDFPVIYIGQTNELRTRINQHEKQKLFWDRCVVFVSTNNFLNTAHVEWLETNLYERAVKVERSKLDNNQTPKKQNLSEMEIAEMRIFQSQILQILPLIGVRAFEEKRAVRNSVLGDNNSDKPTHKNVNDLIVVPAKEDGFNEVFIGENCWYAVRIGGGNLDKIKYIAAYRSNPISAITHVATVEAIEPYGDTGKYKLIFSAPAKEIKHIPFGDSARGSMQSTRYASYKKLQSATSLVDLFK